MPARFFNPTLMPNGDLRVCGPFDTSDQLMGDVQVRFLLIEKPEEGSNAASSTQRPWVVDGVATCPHGGDTFEKIVPRAEVPRGLAAGDELRGIGLAVAVKRFPEAPGDPP